MKHLIVSLHDVHPGSLSAVEKQRSMLSEWGVRCASVLLVPEFHHGPGLATAPSLISWATTAQQQGDELVLHGYYHDRLGRKDSISQWFWTRLYTNREAEYLDLPPEEARDRLSQGRRMLGDLGWKIHGFIAPAWLMSPIVPPILRELGFDYTNTIQGILALGSEIRHLPGRSLCWSVRAAWRRQASLAWNAWLGARLRQASLVRVSLHPRDFEFVTVRQQIEWQIKSALDAGFQAVTYASYVSPRPD